MARIRNLLGSDIPLLRQIHKKYYSDLEFFLDRPLLSMFVVEDNNKKIIMAGGIEGIGESLILTDKSQSNIKIGKALVLAQHYSIVTCRNHNIQELYAFVTEADYEKHLIQHGFEKREDTVLRMRV